VVRHDVATGIDFIGRGVTDSIPQLDRRKIGALIQSANSAGQTVLLDSPPALATIDTPILAGLVESTLLVAKWGRTGRDAVEAAVQRLAPSSQSEILAVINRVNLRRQALYGFRDAGPFASTFRSFHRKRA
jgi:receptor protein-tyrosine kinase